MPPLEYRVTDLFDTREAEFSVEEDTGRMMATVRILKAGKSKNNRNYRASALKEAVEKELFNGVRMFINHDNKPPMKRSLTDMVSAIESTTYHEADQAIDGRVQFFNKEFYDFAQNAKNYMGDSINALVRGRQIRNSDGTVEEDIDSIVQPRSVDWVIYPAAGGNILAFEGVQEGEEVDWGAITLDELRKNAPHLVTEMETAIKADPDPKDDDEGDEEPEALTKSAIEALVQEGVQKYIASITAKAATREEVGKKVRETFKTSGLPEKTRTRLIASFESEDSYDEEKIKEAIKEAKEELAAAGVGPRISGNGPSAGAAGTPASFSVKESVEAHFGMKGSTDSDASSKGAK